MILTPKNCPPNLYSSRIIPMQPHTNEDKDNQNQNQQGWCSNCCDHNLCWSQSESHRCPSSKSYSQEERHIKCERGEEPYNNIMVEQEHNFDIVGNVGVKGSETISHLIEGITFDKKKSIRKSYKDKSQTSSRSSLSSYEAKQPQNDQSKCWTHEQQILFIQLIEKYGTDFNFIKQSFPKKSKSQIKNRYKQITNMKKKTHKKASTLQQQGNRMQMLYQNEHEHEKVEKSGGLKKKEEKSKHEQEQWRYEDENKMDVEIKEIKEIKEDNQNQDQSENQVR